MDWRRTPDISEARPYIYLILPIDFTPTLKAALSDDVPRAMGFRLRMGRTYAGLDKRIFDDRYRLSNHVAWKKLPYFIPILLSGGAVLPYKLETRALG